MSKTNNKYSKEFKLVVVKRYLEGNGGYLTIAKGMNIKNDSQVADWFKKFKLLRETAFDFETRGKFKDPTKERPKTKFNSLEEEIEYLRMKNKFLKKLWTQQKSKKINIFHIIDEMRDRYSLSSLCHFAECSRSGYYKWKNRTRTLSKRDKQNIEITVLILECHKKFRRIYGVGRLQIYVNKNTNYQVNHKKIYRIIKENGIKSVIRKKYKYRHYQPTKVAQNILNCDQSLKKF